MGSHLCERLLEGGDEVICLDNLFTSRLHNVEYLIGKRGFEFVRHDVCDPFHFEVDRIWSLACPASPLYYQQNGVRTIKTSIMGTIHALELAREVGARMLLTSTSEIYGEPLEHPQRESYRGNVDHNGPRACYDSSKCAAEALTSTWARQYGTEVRIARLFNVYGPRMAVNDGRVVSNLIVQALKGEPLTVYGDGTQTRSFMYVSDLVEGLVRLMDFDAGKGETRYDGDNKEDGIRLRSSLPVNLGNPVEYTIGQLAEAVQKLLGGKIEHRPLPVDDPTRRKPDISRARALLGWEPKVSLQDGLARTVDYFRSVLK